MVHLVALLQAAQNRDGVLDRGLVHQHLLEAPLERCVLLDVLAILIQRRGTDAVQLPARQCGLEHVAGIHGPFGLAGAHHGVQLIDEEDDLALLLGEIVQHRFQALLKFAPELGAGDQRAHVERQDALVLESFGHLAVDDALGESLDDRGLADAGLTDQHRVVLGPALQHLDGAPDLIVAPDHRIELAGSGTRGEIDGVLLERLAALFRVGIGDFFPAAHLIDSLLEGTAHEARFLEQARERALLEGGEHEQLARNELVATLLRELVGDVEDAIQVVGDMDLPGRAFDLRQAIEQRQQAEPQLVDVRTGLHQQRAQRP